jgi:hypothetical protein
MIDQDDRGDEGGVQRDGPAKKGSEIPSTRFLGENWQERRGDEAEDCGRWTKNVDEYYCSPFVSIKYRWMSFAMCTHTKIRAK